MASRFHEMPVLVGSVMTLIAVVAVVQAVVGNGSRVFWVVLAVAGAYLAVVNFSQAVARRRRR